MVSTDWREDAQFGIPKVTLKHEEDLVNNGFVVIADWEQVESLLQYIIGDVCDLEVDGVKVSKYEGNFHIELVK